MCGRRDTYDHSDACPFRPSELLISGAKYVSTSHVFHSTPQGSRCSGAPGELLEDLIRSGEEVPALAEHFD
jgi:hypothetical protein